MKHARSGMVAAGLLVAGAAVASFCSVSAAETVKGPVKLFLLGGQSNMDGCGRAEEWPVSYQAHPANVVTWDNQQQGWVPLARDSMAIARHQQFGPEIAFAHRLAKAYPDQTIAISKTSAGGTKLHTQWVPGKGMYEKFIRNFRNASRQLEEAGVDYEVAGMLWMQGESDSETVEMATAYETNLKLLIADVRKQTGHAALPFVMGRISSSLLKKTPWNFDQARTVQAAQEAVAAEDEHVYIINTDALSTLEDNTHFNTEAQLTLGTQMGDVMLRELAAQALHAEEPVRGKPNILFCLSDDQSYPHAGAYGEPVIKTPVFDRIAREGVLFTQAYCAAPSCTPSRSAILTGQDIWRLGQGGQLFGTLPAEHPVYTDLLTGSGYHIGYMDKGWAPGNVQAGGRTSNPAGAPFKNFQEFLGKAPEGQPWCFWFGSRDPHRGYKKGSGVQAGMDPAKVRVPAIFPDTPEVRSDLCDYFLEIQRFDQQVGTMLELIEKAGQLDNTLVVITSDNGMPFPRAKANLYDLGTRMPLAIRWPKRVPGGRTVDDFVNLTDLAPTFLEAAGLAAPEQMTGRSLLDLLRSTESGIVEPGRDAVYAGRERHAWCRIDGKGYPVRMIRTRDFLYIRNCEPERWPAGIFGMVTNEGHYGDIDASPTKDVMIKRKDADPNLFGLSFDKRPREELYDCRKDPYQMLNQASNPEYTATLGELSDRLTAHLKATGDPRETTGETPWDGWTYYGRNRWQIPLEPATDTEPDASEEVRTENAN